MRWLLLGLTFVGVQACIVLTDFDFHEVTGAGGSAQGGQGGHGGQGAQGSACDRDCQGGACIDGQCQPVLLHEGAAGEEYKHVDVRDGFVYWTVVTLVENMHELRSIGSDGSNERVVATFAEIPDFVAVTEGKAVVTSFGGSRVHVVDLATQRTVLFADEMGMGGVVGVAVEGLVVVYHVQGTAGAVRQKIIDGGAAIDLATGQSLGFGIAIEAGQTFWSTIGDLANPGTIQAATVPLQPEVLATNEDKPSGIDVDATHVYWIDGKARIRSAERHMPRTIQELYPGYPDGEKGFGQLVRVDDSHVYATIQPAADPSESGVLRVDKATREASFVVDDSQVYGLADDDTTIYYTTRSNPPRLWKLAK